ncbi:MAG: MotA/TolQ/ExbB proton channel family protein [Planctomycetales bacterium]|nr:MotA/TolQ/ExbB proton channel family protein [Planctomycetales bacterium]
MAKSKNSSQSILRSIGWPIVWGVSATVVFYWCLRRGFIQSELVHRYTAGHAVEVVEVAMFLIGLMFLGSRAWNLVMQSVDLGQVKLRKAAVNGDLPSDSTELINGLGQLSTSAQNSYLGRRILNALTFVERKQSAEGLDDELKYHSDMDAVRAHDGYSFVRIIIWATPMLGFLGTVMGITLALGDLSPEALVNSPTQAMEGLLAGLSVAFDTTALALTLSIALMFLQFLVSQGETQLLATVDQRAIDMLGRRFAADYSTSGDGSAAAIERMSQAMLLSIEGLVERQAEVWQSSMHRAHDHWNQMVQATSDKLNEGMKSALHSVATEHSDKLSRAEIRASERAAGYWNQIHQSVVEHSKTVRTQQTEMAKQTELLGKIMNASEAVRTLEDSLNQNLRALAGAKNFEDTVMSLSAAVHLLSSRLGRPMPKDARIVLNDSPDESRGHAA